MAASNDQPLLRRLVARFGRQGRDAMPSAARDQSDQAGAQSIRQATLRQSATLVGAISVVTITPEGDHQWLEAELSDGTGSVTLVWMGRRTVPGIVAGRRLRVQGVVTGDRGRKVIYNPRYDLLVA